MEEAGDANRDRTVDISDLGILATNWQGSGKTFVQGDFNYDGIVDISDPVRAVKRAHRRLNWRRLRKRNGVRTGRLS